MDYSCSEDFVPNAERTVTWLRNFYSTSVFLLGHLGPTGSPTSSFWADFLNKVGAALGTGLHVFLPLSSSSYDQSNWCDVQVLAFTLLGCTSCCFSGAHFRAANFRRTLFFALMRLSVLPGTAHRT